MLTNELSCLFVGMFVGIKKKIQQMVDLKNKTHSENMNLYAFIGTI